MKETKAQKERAELKRLNDQVLRMAKQVETVCAERTEFQDLYHKMLAERDALNHVIIEAGIWPGLDYPCRCDQCRQVAAGMAAAGYVPGVSKDFWWSNGNG